MLMISLNDLSAEFILCVVLLARASESEVNSRAAGSQAQREGEETANLSVNCGKDF